jgi:hypothetical protein
MESRPEPPKGSQHIQSRIPAEFADDIMSTCFLTGSSSNQNRVFWNESTESYESHESRISKRENELNRLKLEMARFEAEKAERQRKERADFEATQAAQSITAEIATSLSYALVGGAALLVPMLIMVLAPSKHQKITSLVTTCVFVIFFAAGLALHTAAVLTRKVRTGESGPLQAKDILGATAAYAAVLVVFVGTSGNMSSV